MIVVSVIAYQAAIFKRFYREPEVHSIEGIGIGLYLTREIISKQNGRIKVTSAVGTGTTFTIFLPNVSLIALGETDIVFPKWVIVVSVIA